MSWFTAAMVYTLIWWIVLFAILPIGTQPVADADSVSGWRGAPERPRMARKIIITTLVAVLLWGAGMLAIHSTYFSFRSGWLAQTDHD